MKRPKTFAMDFSLTPFFSPFIVLPSSFLFTFVLFSLEISLEIKIIIGDCA